MRSAIPHGESPPLSASVFVCGYKCQNMQTKSAYWQLPDVQSALCAPNQLTGSLNHPLTESHSVVTHLFSLTQASQPLPLLHLPTQAPRHRHAQQLIRNLDQCIASECNSALQPSQEAGLTGAMPDARRMLEEGQWAMPTPSCAHCLVSESSSMQQWANQTSSLSHPTRLQEQQTGFIYPKKIKSIAVRFTPCCAVQCCAGQCCGVLCNAALRCCQHYWTWCCAALCCAVLCYAVILR